MPLRQSIIIFPIRRRNMHNPRPLRVRHKLRRQYVITFRFNLFQIFEQRLIFQPRQLRTLNPRAHHFVFSTLQNLLQQTRREDHHPLFPTHPHRRISHLRLHRQRQVRRQRPRRRRPRQQIHRLSLRSVRSGILLGP